VLDAADVLVHRHPVLCARAHHRGVERGIAVAHEVPRRIHEGVHRVGLAPRRLAAGRAGHVQEGRVLVQRVARAVGDEVFGQHHRQITLGHRHGAVFIAVDDGNRRAPVTLAADAPVAQPPGGLLAAQTLVLERLGDGIDGELVLEPAQVVGVDGDGARLVGVPVLPAVVAEVLAVHRDDLQDVQVVFLGEGEVAFVVGGHAHHRAVAVAHQHVVAYPQRHRLVGERVKDGEAGRHALLFLRGNLGLGRAAGLALGNEGGDLGVGLRGMRGQRMLGRDGAEGHAHDGVGARGEHMHPAAAHELPVGAADVVGEGEAHAFAPADPVLLHQLHALGPAGQMVLHVVEQFGGVLRDVQVVARDLALLDRRTRAPAAPVDHLLVGKHRLVDRVPVDDLRATLGDARVQHLQEQPLVPLVVLGRTGGDLAAPVDGQPHRLHLALHVGDVVVGPLRRRHLVLHRRVLGRQAERIPAHGHQHVHALHAQVAREHVVDGVVAHMPHVQLAAGVRQHRAGVELLAARILRHTVGIARVPGGLRGTLDLVGAEVWGHGAASGGRPRERPRERPRKGTPIIGRHPVLSGAANAGRISAATPPRRAR